MNSVDPRLLRTLLAVMRHGSMSTAAAALGYVPSAVSQHIARLEQRVGAELLSRRPGGGVTPTASGRALADAAAHVLAATADFQRLADDIARSGAPEVSIGVYATAAGRLLPTALAELRGAHPDVVLHVTETEPVHGLRGLRTGEIDLLLAYRYLPEDPPSATDLQIRALGREPLWLMAARGTGIATLDDCREADWAAGHLGTPDRRLLQRWAHRTGLEPAVRYETDDYHTALALIAQGLAVGLVPASVVHGWHDPARPLTRVEGIPASDRPEREVLAVTRPRASHPVVDDLAGLLSTAVTAISQQPQDDIGGGRRRPNRDGRGAD
ncbi:LysR family transcriptional regulator [Streptomyces xanthii]|uniref:LysR family transcriptional regulator n=1 Tax=Streptomyces xanthii TaxID=2768069 RepID=A0A7H1B0S0_9ACTN|nr:LysR family transcriptional regulator [Streptomyces xanthii]QNS02325.1 LysR family transcriptional regulator [Streptomyces xanthii]